MGPVGLSPPVPDAFDAQPSERSTPPAPLVVAVGGLDPGGGAGLVRDYLSASALGVGIRLLGTAWTEQSAAGVIGVEPRAADAVRAALGRLLAEAPRGRTAVKVGMVATPEVAAGVAAALAGFGGPVVVDPVLSASAGGALFSGGPGDLWPLLRRASLVTPNAVEAAALSGRPVATADQAAAAARVLIARGAAAVLVKGGHLEGPEAIDLLVDRGGERRLAAPRAPGRTPRGTGCALATAIAARLAAGDPLAEAVATAKRWLADRIAGARVVGDELHLG